jgi:hypothetical protein
MYTLLNVFAIANRVQNYISDHAVFVLYLLQFSTQPLQGFMNAIAYLTEKTGRVERRERR